MRIFIIFFIVIIILLAVFLYFHFQPTTINEQGSIEVFFCPRENCGQVYLDILTTGKNINCAFYDLRLPELQELLIAKNANVLIDEDNKDKFPSGKTVSHGGLMHNKFCIVDNILITGSYNPTLNTNNNNLLIITSPTLIKNYQEEFDEIRTSQNKKTKHTTIIFNNYTLQNYFCPDDNCQEKVLKLLEQANSSIHFMIFSFTDKKIGDLLQEKAKRIDVRGLLDKTQAAGPYAQYKHIKETVTIRLDTNPKFLHHKVFIIDNNTVITGSYNPTQAGTTKNDENILIIREPKVVKAFVQEFMLLSEQQSSP